MPEPHGHWKVHAGGPPGEQKAASEASPPPELWKGPLPSPLLAEQALCCLSPSSPLVSPHLNTLQTCLQCKLWGGGGAGLETSWSSVLQAY